MTRPLAPGDRVVYKHDPAYPGNSSHDGATGTVVSVTPLVYRGLDQARVDWDNDHMPEWPIHPYTNNLQPLPAVVTPITTEYETESQNDDPASDPVAHPSHYTQGLYEVWRVIRDWKLNFNRGSAVKYIARAGKKDDELQDLRKARQFLDFEIEAIEAERKAAN